MLWCHAGMELNYYNYTTQKLTEMLEVTPSNEEIEPLIVHIGANDLKANLGSGYPISDVLVGDIWTVVRLAKNKFPRARITISGLLRNSGIEPEGIRAINDNLKWLAHTEDLGFIEVDPLLTKAHFSSNGLHLNKKGTSQLTSANFMLLKKYFL